MSRHAAEAAHQVLERQGMPLAIHRHRLAVEHGAFGSHALADHLRHVGQAGGHVLELPGVDAHLGALLVDLHPGAVQLVFEGQPALVPGKGLAHLLGSGGQHRLEGTKELDARRSQGGLAFGQGHVGHLAQVAPQLVGAHDDRRGHPGRPGDPLQHDPLAGAVAHLAKGVLDDHLGFDRVGALQETAQQSLLPRSGSAARRRRDLFERLVYLQQGQRGWIGRRPAGALQQELDRLAAVNRLGIDRLLVGRRRVDQAVHHRTDRLPAHVQRSFVPFGKDLAGDQSHCGRHLLWFQALQKIGQQSGQLQPLAGLLHAGEQLGQVGQGRGRHGAIAPLAA